MSTLISSLLIGAIPFVFSGSGSSNQHQKLNCQIREEGLNEMLRVSKEMEKEELQKQENLLQQHTISLNLRSQITADQLTTFKNQIDIHLVSQNTTLDYLEPISAHFSVRTNAPIDIKKARQLLISGAHYLIEKANQKEKDHPLIQNFPYSHQNINYNLCFMDKYANSYFNKEWEEDSNRLFSCAIREGNVSYFIGYTQLEEKCVYQEPYEEALQIIQRERPDLL